MIKKLKIKFIILSMTSLFVLLTVIVAGMNIINYSAVVNEADEILSLLTQNKGAFPNLADNNKNRLPHGMSPELPYESRYFSALLDHSGDIIYTETSKIASIDSTSAVEYAHAATNKNTEKGFIGNFRFISYIEGQNSRIIFLDCGRKLNTFYNFFYASCGMAIAGLIIISFVIIFFSGKILRPIAESYEKQKRFITDAGHEIKTPLTIINANADVLEMDLGTNEYLEDIQLQTKRLTSLTNDLVLLARMEEAEDSMQMIDFPISEVIADTALPFKTLAQTQGKDFICNIQPLLSMNGNDKSIRQLISILMDNALKYSPEGGKIALDFFKQSKTLCLTIFNTADTEISHENLNHVFDRFYRTDLSRNSETGGHGIGLSVAKAIVTAHGGKIQATSQDGRSFQITVTLPI